MLNCVSEEIKSPVKNMPRAIILSITTITLVYIMANAAYFAVLTKAEMLESEAIAVTFGERALSFATWLMPLLVALSTMGGLNGSIFAASRILLAAARQGQLFSVFNMIHINRLTPIPSLVFLGAISSLYLFTTEILALINYMVFIEAMFAALGVSTVLRLRFKLPDIERPLRIYTLVPVLYLLFSLLLIVLPAWNSPVESAIGILILLTGIPVYYLTAHWKNKPIWYQQSIDTFNLTVQKLTLCVTPTSDV